MEQSLPFYRELLGLEVMLDAEHENYFRSSAENAKVADWLAKRVGLFMTRTSLIVRDTYKERSIIGTPALILIICRINA